MEHKENLVRSNSIPGMSIEFRSEPELWLLGYSPESPEMILEKVFGGARPSSLKGDFILVVEGEDRASNKPLTVFISTVVAAVPYYFYASEERCYHADNATVCCKSAGLAWEWNWDALAQIALFDHVLGDASLHRLISRIPQASIVKVCGGEIEQYQDPFWDELYDADRYDADLKDAPSLLIEILSELPAEKEYSISLSAGYDSRVLLACMSYLNRPVVTACMGEADSTDPKIARQLARAAGYDFERVQIDRHDYVRYAADIEKATSGEKTFLHWHTGIFSKKVSFDPASFHLAGSNGEFARSYYFNKGFAAEFIDKVGFTRWDYWLTLKYARRRRVAPVIVNAIEPGNMFLNALDAKKQMKLSYVPGLRYGDGLDYFYAKERVRNFIGLGIALYRTSFPTMSPFLDARFIRYSANLGRQEKLGDRLPRTVIAALQPALLDLPTNESKTPMHAEPGPFYFLEHKQVKGYAKYSDAQNLPEVTEWSRSGFAELGGNLQLMDDNDSVRAAVNRWNLAITVGAFLETMLD